MLEGTASITGGLNQVRRVISVQDGVAPDDLQRTISTVIESDSDSDSEDEIHSRYSDANFVARVMAVGGRERIATINEAIAKSRLSSAQSSASLGDGANPASNTQQAVSAPSVTASSGLERPASFSLKTGNEPGAHASSEKTLAAMLEGITKVLTGSATSGLAEQSQNISAPSSSLTPAHTTGSSLLLSPTVSVVTNPVSSGTVLPVNAQEQPVAASTPVVAPEATSIQLPAAVAATEKSEQKPAEPVVTVALEQKGSPDAKASDEMSASAQETTAVVESEAAVAETVVEQPVAAEAAASEGSHKPEAAVYSDYVHVIGNVTRPLTMYERMSNRYWTGQNAFLIAQGDEDATPNETLTEAGLVWARIEAAHRRAALRDSEVDSGYKSRDWNLRIGLDNQLYGNEESRVLGSVWLQYGKVNTDISSLHGDGLINTNAYSLGGALTWMTDDGYYIDTQAQYAWIKSELASDTVHGPLKNSLSANGLGLSLEAGKHVSLNDNWTWIPQVQLSWNRTGANDFTDPHLGTVSFDALSSLTLRGGLALEYAKSWQDKDGYTSRFSGRAVANLHHDLRSQNAMMTIGDKQVKLGREEPTWAELGLSGRYSFKDGKYAIFGEAVAGGALENTANNQYAKGKVGLQIKW